MAEVMLTVSGVIEPDAEARASSGETPRRDYLELARALPADLMDYSRMRAEATVLEQLVERLAGSNVALALVCFRRRGQYKVLFTDGEQVGIPLALLLKVLGRRGARHVMIAHILSVGRKMVFFDLLGIQSHVDRFLVYATRQKRFIEERWKVPPERVTWTPFQADGQFFHPDAVSVGNGAAAKRSDATRSDAKRSDAKRSDATRSDATILSVGLEFRDYPTLMDAVRELADVQVIVAAGSPWSKRPDSTAGEEIPPNVTVQRFTQYELRDLYAHSRFVVVPLYDVEFQAGVTTILEAMAMGKALIVTSTQGQTDVVAEGETGIYVPPGDPEALRAAIRHLLDRPDEAMRLGNNGRRLFEERMSLDRYVAGLKHIIEEVMR